ncbi:MAG: KH domain-containing protein, partial [Fimbriimonadales bacterium]
MLREFLEASVRALVDDQQAVVIEEERNGSRLRYRIIVAEGDRGRVIGKNGRMPEDDWLGFTHAHFPVYM